MRSTPTYLKDDSGSTLPVFGISLMGIFSIVGMAIALNFDSQAARSLQDTADTAALAGATAFITATSGSADDHRQLAYDTADGFARANAEDELKSVAVSAVTTDEYGQHTEVNVLLEYHPANIFNRFAGKGETSPVTRAAKAIATREFPLCLLALEPSETGIRIAGNGELAAPNCAIWSNSSSLEAIKFEDGGSMTASSICAVGRTNGDTLSNVTPPPTDNCQAIPDPLADWTPPTIGSCDTIGGYTITESAGVTARLSPGVFCGGLWAVSDKIKLDPGLYVIKDGPLYLNGSDELIAEGVTFLLSGANATVHIQGDGILNVTAPDTGPNAGIALIEDRKTYSFKNVLKAKLAGKTVKEEEVSDLYYATSTVDGNGQILIEGLIYLPTQKMQITGNGWGKKSSPYLQIVARFIEITDLGQLDIDFRPSEMSVPVVIEPERIARLVR